MSKHSIEDAGVYPASVLDSARDAASFARVTGSVGSTVDDVKVDAIKYVDWNRNASSYRHDPTWGWATSAAWLVPDAGVVIVLASRPGRYTSHAA